MKRYNYIKTINEGTVDVINVFERLQKINCNQSKCINRVQISFHSNGGPFWILDTYLPFENDYSSTTEKTKFSNVKIQQTFSPLHRYKIKQQCFIIEKRLNKKLKLSHVWLLIYSVVSSALHHKFNRAQHKERKKKRRRIIYACT